MAALRTLSWSFAKAAKPVLTSLLHGVLIVGAAIESARSGLQLNHVLLEFVFGPCPS